MTVGTLKERVMVTFAINTHFLRKRPARVVLTILSLSGVVVVFLPFVDGVVPVAALLDQLDPPWLALLGPSVVLPFFISVGYLRWILIGRPSRWEEKVGYALAVTVAVLLSLVVIQVWWESGLDHESWFVLFLFVGLGAAAWFVIRNLRGKPPAQSALVAMQLAYLPFTLGWLWGPVRVLIEGDTAGIGIGVYLAVVTTLVYTAQAALSVRGKTRLWLQVLPLGVVWLGGLTAGSLAWS